MSTIQLFVHKAEEDGPWLNDFLVELDNATELFVIHNIYSLNSYRRGVSEA